MAIPKKQKPLIHQNEITKAIKIAEKAAPKKLKPVNTDPSPIKIDKKPVKKKPGRVSLAGNRSAKITFYLSPNTKKRFQIAFSKELVKCAEKDDKIDKSFIIERALLKWMEDNDY